MNGPRFRLLKSLFWTALAIATALHPPMLYAESPPAQAPRTEPRAADGLKVYLDPETGAIVSEPTPEQVRALDLILEQAGAPGKDAEIPEEKIEPFQLSDGGMGVHVGGRFTSSLMIHLHPDGSWRTVCADPMHAEQILNAPPTITGPPRLEEK